MSNTEIVSVTYRRVKAGESEPDHFCDFPVQKPNHEDWDWEKLPLYDWSGRLLSKEEKGSPEDRKLAYIDLPEDWYGLSFEFFGQLFEGQELGLSVECDSIGPTDVFGEWGDELRAIGDHLLDAEIESIKREGHAKSPAKVNWEMPKQVTFLTAWKYTVEIHRSWDGDECDTDWELLGLIDLTKIQSPIIPRSEIQSQPSTT